jgi:O-antigen ligase
MVRRTIRPQARRLGPGRLELTSSARADAVGAGLVLLIAVSSVASSLVNGVGDPGLVLVPLAGAVVFYAAGRVLAPVLPAATGLVVATIVLVLVATPYAQIAWVSGPPLWYANANAALYVQLAALTAMVAIATDGARWRMLMAGTATGLVLLAGWIGSLAGFLTGVAVLATLVATLTGWRPARRAALTSLVAVVLVAHVAVLALGVTYRFTGGTSGLEEAAASSLSERRLLLWSDAIVIAAEHPVTGVGPGGFATTSPTARADSDTREAHSATLQMAAETGWGGAVALLALLLWAAARPLCGGGAQRAPGTAVVAATAVGALSVHAAVDYVLQFPVVIAAAAFVLGAGTARSAAFFLPPAEQDPPPARD